MMTWQRSDMMPRAHPPLTVKMISVVIEPVLLNNFDALKSLLLKNMDPVSQSCKMGIDLYMKALELVPLELNNLMHGETDVDGYKEDMAVHALVVCLIQSTCESSIF